MIYVRRALDTDVPSLLWLCERFHAESPVHSKLGFNCTKVDKLIRACLENPDWLPIVAVNDEAEIVGMALLFCMEAFFSNDREVGELTFYVTPEHRGGRAALLMMREALAWADLKGAKRVGMGITTGINVHQAERFYGRFGFERTGVLMQRSEGAKPL